MIKKINSILLLLFFILTCIVCALYNYFYYSITPTYQQKLVTMTSHRGNEINTYLNKQEQNAVSLSQEAAIINALYSKKIRSGDKELTALIATHKESMGFKNILLIDNNGTIIFSTTKQNLVDINLKQPLYTSSSLSKSYERASLSLTTDFSYFNFNELLEEPALFITIPFLKEKKFIGALAYQLNQEKMFLITHQYIGLEKTGEVVLAKKDGPYVTFLAPTRNDPDLAFKKRLLFTDPPISIQAAVLGQKGSGTAIDYRGKHIVGAWQFIPKLDWGMLIKIDQEEILKPTNTLYKILLLCILLFILSLLINVYLSFAQLKQLTNRINKQAPLKYIPSLFKNPLFIALLFACCLTTKNIIQCYKKQLSTIKNAKNKTIETTTQNAANIETILKKIEFIGQSIADDLRTNYLAKDDITTRINRDITENDIITDMTVLFAPYTYNKTTELYIKTTSNIQETTDIFKTKWYTQAMQFGSTWIVNHQQNNNTATYACTFFDKDKKPQGVIAITFSLKSIITIVESNSTGKTGYSIIMTNNGTFIFHPTKKLVKNETTLMQYAQARGNEELATIAQKVGAGNALMASYTSESTQEQMWIYTQPIPINNWIIGSIFSQDEVGLPSEIIRQYYFWILIWATITLLLLTILMWQFQYFTPIFYAITANIILILALICAWYIIQHTATVNRESRIVITDQSSLNKFLNDLNEEAERKHESAPINIPCGILLYSLSLSGTDNMTVSGYIWNKYNTQLQTHVIRGMDLPQATRMTFSNPLTSKTDTEETYTWNIQGVMYQEQSYSRYPFDQQHIQIILEHKDIEKNIILTPDLVGYKKISPEATPGLDKEFSLTGFTIEQTFFEYRNIDPNANFGFKEYGKVTDNYHLIYNIIINRNLLNPFVLYLLPLLVILFSLFTTLLVAKRTTAPLTILAGYSGLFFALIMLQRSLREQYPTGTTLYMEYAFFYTYITIIFLIIHTILMHYYKRWNTYQDTSLYITRILFWPFQFIIWLITTLIIFY